MMERSLNDIIGQVVDKANQPRGSSPEIFGRIRFVDYSTGHIVVKAKGFGTIRKIRVQRGIQLGTTDRPVVVVGDIATLRRKGNGRWICTAIEHKDRCASSSALVVEVEVDTSSSYVSQQLSSLEIPDDLRPPPLIPLANFTLPSLRFPDPTTYLCGIPQCTNCAPNGYVAGMAVVLSSDVDHPLGCWVWGFRSGGCNCGGSLLEESYSAWEAGLVNPSIGRFVPKGNYGFYTIFNNAGTVTRLIAIDATDATSPIQADILDIAPTTSFVDALNNLLYMTGQNASDNINLVDISNPASLSLAYTYTSATPLFSNQVFVVGANTYLAALHTYDSSPTSFGLKVFDVTNPSAVTLVSTTNPASGSFGWRSPTTSTMFPENNGWHIANSIFYSMVDFPGEIDIYDFSAPASPVLLALFNTGYEYVTTLRASETHLWIGAKKALDTSRYLVGYDISNPAVPVMVSETNVGTGATENPISIALCRDILVLAKNTATTVKFETWDISDPTLPVLMDTLTAANPLRVPAHPVRLANNHLYLAGSANLLSSQPRLIIATC